MKSVVYVFCAFLFMSPYAQAATIASFADPGTSSFVFEDNADNSDGIGFLSAANSDIQVILPLVGLTFSDASYTLTDTSGNPLQTLSQFDNPLTGLVDAQFEAGILTIITDIAEHGLNANDVLLTATFDSAIGVFGNLFSADSLIGNNVTFSGFALNGLSASAEQFSFSASNVDPVASLLAPGDLEDFTATASFTSSAVVVPVPAAVWLFASGLLALVGYRRQ